MSSKNIATFTTLAAIVLLACFNFTASALLLISAGAPTAYAQMNEHPPGQVRVSANQISVSVTQGGSSRLLTLDEDGSPTLYDNPVGEGLWKKSASPSRTSLPQDTTVLGLANAEVRAYSAGAHGITEFRATRTTDAWSHQTIDERTAQGQACAVRSGNENYVFAQRAGTGLIALREQAGGMWKQLTQTESLFQTDEIAAISCGAAAGMPNIAVAATLRNGALRVAFVEEDETRASVSELKPEADASADLAGRVALAADGVSLDVFGITRHGALLHWQRSADSSWLFERVSPMGIPVLGGSPTAVWHEKRLLVVARTYDQHLTALTRSSEQQFWAMDAPPIPGGDLVASDPHLASQPEELSLLAALKSGAVLTLKFENESWTPGLLNEASAGFVQSAALQLDAAHALALGTIPGGKPIPRPVPPATQTLQQYIDSIPLLAPAPEKPPTVTHTDPPTYHTEHGVRFQDLTNTVERSANLSEVIAFNPNIDVLWAGAGIQGKTIFSGLLAGIGLPRAPLTITIRDVGGYGPLSRTIASPSLATVATGVRDLIKDLGPVKATAFIDFDSQSGQTVEDALLKVGVSVDFLGQRVKSSVQSTSSKKSSTVVVKLLQRYYTIAVDTPSSPSAIFAPGVTADDAKRFISVGNPASYISQIQYGRMLFYIFESSETTEKLEATVDAVFNFAKISGSVSLNDEQRRVFSNTRVRMFALGGLAQDVMNTVTGDFTPELNKYLTQGANFSVDSPGAPLAYTIKWLKNGTVAQMNVTTHWYTTATYALPEEGSFIIGLGNTNQRDCKDWGGPDPSRNIKPYPIGVVQTGFYVRPGDRFAITAMGQVWSGVFATGFNPPNGWYTWKTPTLGVGFLNETVSPFSLLFRIGDMNQPPYVGYGFPSREYQGSTGELGLLINTNNPNQGSGCFKATIKVERRQN